MKIENDGVIVSWDKDFNKVVIKNSSGSVILNQQQFELLPIFITIIEEKRELAKMRETKEGDEWKTGENNAI